MTPRSQFLAHLARRYRSGLRLISLVLLPTQLTIANPSLLYAQTNPELAKPAVASPAPASSPAQKQTPAKSILPNRILPPLGPAKVKRFSDPPTDREITTAGLFPEPLVAVGTDTTPSDNRAIADLLRAWGARVDTEDFSLLDSFIALHPTSPWVVGLLVNEGIDCRHRGYFSKALEAWRKAWELGRKETAPKGRALVDRAAGELAELNARLGRYEWLEKFFKEIDGRNIGGSATEKIAGARQGLSLMRTRPEDAFRCGPMALDRIRARINPKSAFDPLVLNSRSTLRGMSLTSVRDLAEKLKMGYVMARRDPGAKLDGMLPAVLHWKVGHYAALTQEKNGRIRVEDPTFGDAIWVSRKAIDSEASGYFLVPASKIGSWPAGWHPVSAQEGNTIWGKGNTGQSDPDRTSKDDPKVKPDCPPVGMASYNVHAMLVSLNIVDTPLGYAPPRGQGINLTARYSQREANQPATFTYSNLGPKWTFDWLSYIDYDDVNASVPPAVYLSGGGVEIYPQVAVDPNTNFEKVTYDYDYSYYPPLAYVATAEYQAQQDSRVVLRKIDRTSFVKTYPDGTTEVFAHLGTAEELLYPRRLFLTRRSDPAGNATTFTYDSQHRLVAVTDALGQITTLSYENEDPTKITKVEDPFGRFAQLDYNTAGQLQKITDVQGLTSEFAYGDADFIRALTTGYGTTSFSMGEDGVTRWLEVTDAQGDKERTEFRQDAPGIGSVEPSENVPQGLGFINGYLNYRNSFFWNKEAYKEAIANGSLDYTKARLYHWLHTVDENVCSGILESTKEAYENRVWFRYPGQTSSIFVNEEMQTQPSAVARVIDDGSTQVSQYEYNTLGRITKAIDPLLRETQFTYDTNLYDLLEVRQKRGTATDLLASYTYNGQHRPLTATDASGQQTIFDYNANGQIETVENPRHEITTFDYDTNGDGYLQSITGALSGDLTQFAYNPFGQVQQVTRNDGYAFQFEYDSLNRVTRVLYPDGTDEQTVYTLLTPEWSKDRLGRWTHRYFNSIRQIVGVEDPEYRFTGYEWCRCGDLRKIIDPQGHITSWVHDAQGRITSKLYPDLRGETYTYQPKSGRLSSMTDAKNQTTNYSYFLDNNLQQVSYANAERATPSVNYAYDSDYNRLVTMTDGTGVTTYAYNPITGTPMLGAERLASVDGPLANDTITYGYDELGRVANRSIDGGANAASVVYDALGRVQSATNPLGSFTYAYVNATGRMDHVDLPGGQKTQYAYFNNAGDDRLQQIKNLDPAGGIISQFDYLHNAVGDISSWTQQQESAATSKRYDFGYDGVDQLRSATLTKTSDQSVLGRNNYDYDAAGNRTTNQAGEVVTTGVFNELNQLLKESGGGKMHFRGTVDEPATVTVGGQQASVDATGNFDGVTDAAVGTNTVPIVATDGSGNSRTNNYQVTVTAGANQTLSYDANGNLAVDGTKSYEWDAANRLLAINYTNTTDRTEFSYDGLGRRTKIVEKTGGTINSTKKFVWDALTIAEERDGSNQVTRRYYPQGEQFVSYTPNTTTPYFYLRDHLGSVREMTDSTGATQAQYDYDPWGNRVKVSGSLDADFGFTGHYYHKPSNLHLAPYRAYDSGVGRWLSRDPIGEAGGLNLYGYVENNAINATDVLGLDGLLVVIRNGGRDSSGTVYLFNNGQYQDSGRVNTNGYYDGTHGVPSGTYDVLPKNNYTPGDAFPPGQPSVTDPRYGDPSSPDYAPGRAGPSYSPTVRIHGNGPDGGPDSSACVTTDQDTLRKIIDLMMSNLNNGGTTLKVYYNSGAPVAVPYRP